jgi:lysophospholipase L1-like esterase
MHTSVALAAATLILSVAQPSTARQLTRDCLGKLPNPTLAHPSDRPEMMAIGDSLYNGVTSLTISIERAQRSVPALVAKALGIASFRFPDYPRPILFDIEKEIAKPALDLIATIGNDITENIKAWGPLPKVEAPFDDVAIAQADSYNMTCDTAEQSDNWIASHMPSIGKETRSVIGIPDELTSWYYAINSRFILGVAKSTSPYWQLSQLGQSIAREPRQLLISVGHNDGMWLMAFEGLELGELFPHGCLPPARSTVDSELQDFVRNMATIARLLAETEIEHLYLNTLPLPSHAANLNPIAGGTFACANPYGRDGTLKYSTWYQTYISDARLKVIRGQSVCAMDNYIVMINDQVKRIMAYTLGARFVSVDVNPVLFGNDGKDDSSLGTQVVLEKDAVTVKVKLDNRVVHSDENIIDAGGLQGYDNMHPSYVGYGLVAKAVLDATRLPYSHLVVDPQNIINEIDNPQGGLTSAIMIGTTEVVNVRIIHTILELPVIPPPRRGTSLPENAAIDLRNILSVLREAPPR